MVLSWASVGGEERRCLLRSGRARWSAWERELAALKERIGPVFGRAETRATAGAFLDGLLSGVARKTGWLLAEQAGLERPYRMQSLLGRSRWDADALRDRVRADVIEALGDRDGVLVVDETGFLKKGEHSVGVARQYSGTAGRIENCQIGVFLAYASRFGQALIDRRLYLPEAWAQDESKRAKAGVPEEITFATKPQIACALIAAALDAGAPCAWVLADALYGSDSRLRRMLETAGAALRARGALQPLPALLDRGGAGGDRPRGDGRCPGERGLGHACRRRGLEGAAAVRVGADRAAFDR